MQHPKSAASWLELELQGRLSILNIYCFWVTFCNRWGLSHTQRRLMNVYGRYCIVQWREMILFYFFKFSVFFAHFHTRRTWISETTVGNFSLDTITRPEACCSGGCFTTSYTGGLSIRLGGDGGAQSCWIKSRPSQTQARQRDDKFGHHDAIFSLLLNFREYVAAAGSVASHHFHDGDRSFSYPA